MQTFAGPGEKSDTTTLTADDSRATALEEMNIRRESADLAPLEESEPLDTVAGRILDARLAGEEPSEDIFGLLPDGSTGWTSISIRSGSRGASGATLSANDVNAFIDDWESSDNEAPFGGARATYLGFAALAQDSGRSTAVAVFGGRE
ncbi:hypothetical protein P775_05620 [Puniceibacterium antarcticum]|uniref:SCP domain-containing protein n=1 Tax=Puniceibacterium antarcticum TaxID=1206336 RepID=A0A2G8RIF9_9RHOB|nr:hypothetical protein [Puniceibacterium antarcticum]PIL21191.1 hypothetical protein P775_05620 [Puniceibacterium antarcticum]